MAPRPAAGDESSSYEGRASSPLQPSFAPTRGRVERSKNRHVEDLSDDDRHPLPRRSRQLERVGRPSTRRNSSSVSDARRSPSVADSLRERRKPSTQTPRREHVEFAEPVGDPYLSGADQEFSGDRSRGRGENVVDRYSQGATRDATSERQTLSGLGRSASPPRSAYKRQGRTHVDAPVASSRGSVGSDSEYEHKSASRKRDRSPVKIVRGNPVKLDDVSTVSKTASRGIKTTPPDVSRVYISPPPTDKRSLRVPDTPRGRVSRRAPGARTSSRKESPDKHHDVYSIEDSDSEPAVRVKSKRRPALVSDAVNISSDDELPRRLTRPRKLQFDVRDDDQHSAESNRRHHVPDESDDDVDERGNARDLIVSDDEEADVFRGKRRRSARRAEAERAKTRAPKRLTFFDDDQDLPRMADKSSASTPGRPRGQSPTADRSSRILNEVSEGAVPPSAHDVVPDSASGSDPISRSTPEGITATTNDGDRVELRLKKKQATVGKAKGRQRSPSRDSDDYRPPAKRSARPSAAALADEDSVPVSDGRSKLGKRRDRSPPMEDPPASRPHKRRPDPESDVEPDSDAERERKRHARELSSKDYQKVDSKASSSHVLVRSGKCKVTNEDDHDGFLVGTYDECFAYLTPNLLKTPQETGAIGVSHFDSTKNGDSRFEATNICYKRLRALIMFKSAADGRVINISRIGPAESGATTSPYTTNNHKALHNLAVRGESVDMVVFGFVAQDGSWLTRLAAPSGPRAPENQGYRALNIYPLNGEYQRALAFLHQAFAPVKQECQMYVTGNAWQATSMWGDRDKFQGRKTLPEHVRLNPGQGSTTRGARGVHPSLARVAKSFTADIPVFDCRRHFMSSHVGEDWRDGFSVEHILTQASSPDERFQGEIPDDSFVAMHCIATMRQNGAVGLNLIGAQVLVTPRVTYYADL